MKRRIGLGAAMALGGGCQHQFGAAHLARPWAPAPSRPAVQAVRSDPDFVGKLRDIVKLYVDPPAHAVVLSVDEKSQIQALDRTQPGLPLKRGRAGTMTHDDKAERDDDPIRGDERTRRNLDRPQHAAPSPSGVHSLPQRRRARGSRWRTIHAIIDTSAAHKHPAARKWLARHPRWTFHFTPTSASWLNAVEGFFAILTKRRLKRGVF
jgi:DDE superfamily endonuclease